MKLKLSVLLLVIFVAAFGFAQSTNGTLAGTVTDSSGAVVPNAIVTATSETGSATRSATTGQSGEYRIESLTPGTYSLEIKASGFGTTKISNVNVRTSAVTSSNIELKVGNADTSVTIEASADAIQSESGELSKTIPQAAVVDLPYISLNPYSLATTLPGVTPPAGRDDFTNGSGFSVNGLRPRANNFLIDGFDNNDNGIAGQAFQPTNTEAVQEVTVLTNSYAAEFGRGGGSVSNLTYKKGTNNFHGGVWEQYNGSFLNALTTQQVGSTVDNRQPQTVSNIFGFRVGGPVIKNKLYAFSTVQWSRIFGAATSASSLTIPTAAGFATLSALAPGNSNLTTLLGELGSLRGVTSPTTIDVGNRVGCGNPCMVEVGKFTRPDTTASIAHEWTSRVDYTPNENDSIFVRYTDAPGSFAPDLFANPGALPYRDTQQGGPTRLLGSMWAHTFNPSVVNEFRFSAQQIDFSFGPTATALASPFAFLPTYSIGGLRAGGGSLGLGGFSQGVFPQGRGHKTFQLQDAVSIVKGRNSFKLGADLTVLLVNDRIPFNTNGSVAFAAGGSCPTAANAAAICTALANYIDDFSGASATLSKNFGSPLVNIPLNQQAYYFQGTFKAKSNLTLDYGVRYEYQPPDYANILPFPAIQRSTVATDPFQTAHSVVPDRNNWGPRVGFAYTPKFWNGLFGDDKTVLRGGYGVFYDSFFTNIVDNTASASPNTLGGTLLAGAGRGLSNPFGQISAITAAANSKTTITSVDSNLRNPMSQQWNLNVQRELPSHIVAEVAYVGTRGEHLWVNEQLNPVVLGGSRVIPTRGSISVRGNSGDSIYHGLQTSVTRNVHNLNLRGSYTWSRAIDNGSEVFVTSGGASRWENTQDPRSDRGPSAFNRTHRASLSYVYDLPFAKDKGFLTQVFGGWATSGVMSWQSGTPETVFLSGWDQNGDGEATNDRPSVGNPAAAINYSAACLNSANPCSGVGLVGAGGALTDFNTGAAGTLANFRYIVNPVNSGVMGNVGRNTLTFPGRQDYNLSVIKRFSLPGNESHRLEFRADFFNAFNHPNAGVTNLVGNILDSDFLNTDITRDGGRVINLWLKYQF
jgi:hypothetical protein